MKNKDQDRDVECACCRRMMQPRARGLCNTCYTRLHKEGKHSLYAFRRRTILTWEQVCEARRIFDQNLLLIGIERSEYVPVRDAQLVRMMFKDASLMGIQDLAEKYGCAVAHMSSIVHRRYRERSPSERKIGAVSQGMLRYWEAVKSGKRLRKGYNDHA